MKIYESIILVTGANKGLGFALSELIAMKGGFPILTGRNEAELKQKSQLLSKKGLQCDFYKLDISDDASISAAIKKILEKHGKIDILINNAGIVHPGLFVNQDIKNVKLEFSTNILGPISLIKALLPAMIEKGKGKIVNIASLNGQIPMAGEASYCATKSALIAFGNALREEIRDYNISVLNVLPGLIDTSMSRGIEHGIKKQEPLITAAEILKGIEKGSEKIICGRINRIGLTFFPSITKSAIKKISRSLITNMH